jgi:histidinol-phosphate aminotransferase
MIAPRRRVAQLVRENLPKVDRQSKLRLDINENVVGWPDAAVREVLGSITAADLAAYPETVRLYQALARHHHVAAANVVVGAGSELVIRYVFEAFLEPGREVLILDPSFAMFDVYGRLYGADVVTVAFDAALEMPIERLLAAISPRTRLIAVANPNNPTGTVFSADDLVSLAARAAAVGAIVLVDEAYFYFCEETLAPRAAALDNVIVTRTFSKAFGLAGVRLGYGLASEPVVAAVQTVQPIDHVSALAVKFGLYAIAHEELAWDYARAVHQGRRHLVSSLRGMGLRVVDGAGNFVLVDFGAERLRIVDALAPHALVGATVRLPFANDYVKITVGPAAEMTRLVDLLRPALATIAAARGPEE